MKLETILNAALLTFSRFGLVDGRTIEGIRLNRQYCAFRARILRMDAEKDAEIEKWKEFARNKEEPKRRGRQ